jgi:ATP-dependent RNA helicase DDX18/HAS1
MFNKKDLK